MSSQRKRIVAFVVLVVGCVAGAVIVVAAGGGEEGPGKPTPRQAQTAAQAYAAGGIVVFRDLSRRLNDNGGAVAWLPLGGLGGVRHSLGVRCARSYADSGSTVCLTFATSPLPGYRTMVFDRSVRRRHSFGLPGYPSRARLSSDGRYAGVTTFVAGHSYAQVGFSTATYIIDLRRGSQLPNLEKWHTTRNGHVEDAVDRNFWGVTFARADSDRFYATLATGGHTYLVQGSVRTRSMRAIHENVECPSVSPDGTRVAYKKRVGGPADWRITVLDLATGRETPSAETNSVDDQVEWLDNGHLLYGLRKSVWTVPADGSGPPRVFLAHADSPAVIPAGAGAGGA